MLKNLHFLIALCFVAFLLSCKEKNDVNTNIGKPNGPCKEDNTCENGYSCIDNSCKCPGTGFVYNGSCVQFDGNNPVYIGSNASCLCYDTLAFSISGTGQNRIANMPFRLGNLIGYTTFDVTYFERPDGDSLHIIQIPAKCSLSTTTAPPEAFGKIQADKSLNLTIVFKDQTTAAPLGTCTMNMKRLK
ncbi:MAG: hypothetical protein WCR52_04855 [Bacteroidota bacterium]